MIPKINIATERIRDRDGILSNGDFTGSVPGFGSATGAAVGFEGLVGACSDTESCVFGSDLRLRRRLDIRSMLERKCLMNGVPDCGKNAAGNAGIVDDCSSVEQPRRGLGSLAMLVILGCRYLGIIA